MMVLQHEMNVLKNALQKLLRNNQSSLLINESSKNVFMFCFTLCRFNINCDVSPAFPRNSIKSLFSFKLSPDVKKSVVFPGIQNVYMKISKFTQLTFLVLRVSRAQVTLIAGN